MENAHTACKKKSCTHHYGLIGGQSFQKHKDGPWSCLFTSHSRVGWPHHWWQWKPGIKRIITRMLHDFLLPVMNSSICSCKCISRLNPFFLLFKSVIADKIRYICNPHIPHDSNVPFCFPRSKLYDDHTTNLKITSRTILRKLTFLWSVFSRQTVLVISLAITCNV